MKDGKIKKKEISMLGGLWDIQNSHTCCEKCKLTQPLVKNHQQYQLVLNILICYARNSTSQSIPDRSAHLTFTKRHIQGHSH